MKRPLPGPPAQRYTLHTHLRKVLHFIAVKGVDGHAQGGWLGGPAGLLCQRRIVIRAVTLAKGVVVVTPHRAAAPWGAQCAEHVRDEVADVVPPVCVAMQGGTGCVGA